MQRDRLNAQISLSTFGASIVPDRPRLLCVLYKANLTHELVAAKGSFSVSLLADKQRDLIPKLWPPSYPTWESVVGSNADSNLGGGQRSGRSHQTTPPGFRARYVCGWLSSPRPWRRSGSRWRTNGLPPPPSR